METNNRFIFPVIATLVLHVFLLSLKISKQDKLMPIFKGNPIRIEVNNYSSKPIVPKKTEETKLHETKPITKAPEKIVQKKAITRPIDIHPKQKKVIHNPKQAIKEEAAEKRDNQTDLQFKQLKSQRQNSTKKAPENLTNKVVVLQSTAIPMYKKNKQPPYPVMAKRRGYDGRILLSVLVGTKGLVSEITIKHSSGHLSLDRAALSTVKDWLFTPASEGDRPVAMWVDVPVEFQLK